MVKIFARLIIPIGLLITGCSNNQPTPTIKAIDPEIKTLDVEIDQSSYTYYKLSGQVDSVGTRPIVSQGFVYSQNPDPNINDSKLVTGGTINNDGLFFGNMTDPGHPISNYLLPSTTYYIKAFVKTDDEKIHYGNSVQLTSMSGKWRQVSNFPGDHRILPLVFVLKNKMYFVSGTSFFKTLKYNDCWTYDPSLDSWSEKNSFPVYGASSITSENSAAFVLDTTAYIVTSSDLWTYNIASDTWSKIGPGINQSHMLSFVINDTAYVGNGANGDLYAFDPVKISWNYKNGSYPGDALYQYYSFSTNGKGYAGYGLDIGNLVTNEFYEYDPTSNMWSKKQSLLNLANSRIGPIGFTLNNKVYMGLGRSKSIPNMVDMYEYDPTLDNWKQVNDLPASGRQDAIAFSINGKSYVCLGGVFINNTTEALLYDLWEFTP